mmetsp:Transcript_3691/g.7152  ORF Transcript_3691/g.7152 Transcript_3691/m.7152 type:complete len:154 (-) Transcript_3691:1425-1886(-)
MLGRDDIARHRRGIVRKKLWILSIAVVVYNHLLCSMMHILHKCLFDTSQISFYMYNFYLGALHLQAKMQVLFLSLAIMAIQIQDGPANNVLLPARHQGKKELKHAYFGGFKLLEKSFYYIPLSSRQKTWHNQLRYCYHYMTLQHCAWVSLYQS